MIVRNVCRRLGILPVSLAGRVVANTMGSLRYDQFMEMEFLIARAYLVCIADRSAGIGFSPGLAVQKEVCVSSGTSQNVSERGRVEGKPNSVRTYPKTS